MAVSLVAEAVSPVGTVGLVESGGGAMPVPVTVMFVLVPALSVSCRVAVLTPVLSGLNVTPISQTPPGAIGVLQPFVPRAKCVKLPALSAADIVVATGPSLLTTTTSSGLDVVLVIWFANGTVVRSTLVTGVLLPVTAIVRVAAAVVSLMVTVALDVALARGVKPTTMSHEAPAATTEPSAQVLLASVKSAALVPPRTMLFTVTSPVPVFVYLTVFAAGAGVAATLPKSTCCWLRLADRPGCTLPCTMNRSVSAHFGVPSEHVVVMPGPTT